MRKTSTDYRNELNNIIRSLESTKAHIKDRLIYLVEKFPEAIIVKKGDDEFKAKSISRPWIERLSIDTQIAYIAAIEDYTKTLERVRQTTIYD